MEQVIGLISQLVAQLNSAVFVLLIILAFSFILAVKIGGWLTSFKIDKERLSKFEARTEKFIEIATKVDLIYQYVNPNMPAKRSSPISLTDIGKEISTKIHADEIFARVKHEAKEYLVRSNREKNAYDIQIACIEWAKKDLLTKLVSDEIGLMKQIAFEKGILLEDVLVIFGVMMRDSIFKDMNIPLTKVDEHEPKM